MSHRIVRGFASALLWTAVAVLCPTAVSAAGEVLRGVVVGPDGRPVPSAQVTVRGEGFHVGAAVDAEGRFGLDLPAGAGFPASLQVTAPGFEPRTLVLDDPSAATRIELTVRPLFTGQVEVTVNRARAGETPVTVTNIDRQEIERRYWGQDVPMFLDSVPGFYAYNDAGHGLGYSYFFLRGFDMRRTAVSLNGVPLNDADTHAVFFVNVADFLATTGDVQVQRGVGTNLYGGSAIGGSVDFRTRTPLETPRLRVDTSHGAWDTSRWTMEYDSGRSDSGWAATFRYSRVDSDGYRDRSWFESWGYYASVEHRGVRTATNLVLFGGPERTHLAFLGVPQRYLEGEVTGDRRRDRRHNPLTYPGEVDDFFQPHYQLHHDWHLADGVTLRNTLYYFEGDGFFQQLTEDGSLASVGLPPATGPDGDPTDTTDLVTRRHIDEWDAGWIPTLEWRHGDGTLQAGVAYREHRGREWGETVWAASFPAGVGPDPRWYDYDLDKRTVQPFVQETWQVDPRWTVLAGVTWTSHTYDLSRDRVGDLAADVSYDYLLPRLGVTFRPVADWSVYANLSRGAREPAFRDVLDPHDAFADGTVRDLDPEELTDLELGAQRDFAGGYARGNLYLLDFDNAIVFAGGVDDDGLPTTANGAVVTQWGVELEAGWTPRPRWGGRLALSYTDATFDEFVEFDFGGGSIDHSGNRVAAVPDWLGTLELHGGVGPVDLLVDVRHVGRFYLDNTEDLRKLPALRDDPGHIRRVNPAFTVLGLSAEVSLGRRASALVGADDLRLRLRIDNLTDELYTTFGYMGWTEPEWIPAATRSAYLGLTVDW